MTFPVFAKIDVNGSNAHPLYRYLKMAKPGTFGTGWIKWNFAKFLVDRSGNVAKRIGTATKPAAIEKDIDALLASAC